MQNGERGPYRGEDRGLSCPSGRRERVHSRGLFFCESVCDGVSFWIPSFASQLNTPLQTLRPQTHPASWQEQAGS